MKTPEQLKYTETHEWVASADDGTLAVGITDHAQEVLGDIVFLELPPVGKRYAQGDACAVIESVKAASDINMPVTGVVVAVNDALAQATLTRPAAGGFVSTGKLGVHSEHLGFVLAEMQSLARAHPEAVW